MKPNYQFTEDQKVELIRLLVERGVPQKIAEVCIREDISISEARRRLRERVATV